MIEIFTTFTPFRMNLSKREPVQLSVELVNRGKEKAMVSLSVNLNKQLSFEKTGYKTQALERIKELDPGEGRRFYYDLWPKQATRAGTQGLELTVLEHYRDFNYVKKEYKKGLGLTVEE